VIHVDTRAGSVELLPLFPPGSAAGRRLAYADFSFLGEGAAGAVEIGVERKTISDLVSSITTGRLSGHQLIGLLRCYAVVYVLVEGLWRPAPGNGTLEIRHNRGWVPLQHGRRAYQYAEIIGYLNTLRIFAGVHVVRTANRVETVKLVCTLAGWWTKPWGAHKSHRSVHVPLPVTVSLSAPPLVARLAAQLPGIGWERARAIAAAFPTPAALWEAGESDLRGVEGIGKTLAARAWEALHGRS